MVVELISVGTELLLGNITNTNASYLARQVAQLGLTNYYQSVVGDNEERLSEMLKLSLSRSDVVILTGGLGPTEDDLTKETVAKTLCLPLLLDEHTKTRILMYFNRNGQTMEIPENNYKQALVIEGSKVIDNHNGTAPGLIITTSDAKTIILLPGPPNELIPMFEKDIAGYLDNLVPEVLYSKMVKICGIGESKAELMIKDLIQNQTNPTIAPYAKVGEVHFRVTAKAASLEEAKKLVKPIVKELEARFEDAIYTTDMDQSLEEKVIELLIENGLTIATAESCTGGLLTARLVNVPGVSNVLKEGFITYSNKAKRKYLDVSKTTLKNYGAVSSQTAKEMAKGAAIGAGADVALAITGIAGPDGGTKEKPVGLVYIGCYVNEKVTVQEYHFKGDRQKVRDGTVIAALDLLRRCILKNY